MTHLKSRLNLKINLKRQNWRGSQKINERNILAKNPKTEKIGPKLFPFRPRLKFW
jgi:hypothetical protein